MKRIMSMLVLICITQVSLASEGVCKIEDNTVTVKTVEKGFKYYFYSFTTSGFFNHVEGNGLLKVPLSCDAVTTYNSLSDYLNSHYPKNYIIKSFNNIN